MEQRLTIVPQVWHLLSVTLPAWLRRLRRSQLQDGS
jgi:hypothetical protein